MKKSNPIKCTILALTMLLLSACAENEMPVTTRQSNETSATVQTAAATTTAPPTITTEATTTEQATTTAKPEITVKTAEEGERLIRHWLVDNPLGVDVDITELDSDEGRYFYELSSSGVKIINMFVNKFSGDLTAANYYTMYDEGWCDTADGWLKNDWHLDRFLEKVNENNDNQGDNNNYGGVSTYENLIGTWTWNGSDIFGAAYGYSSNFSISFYSNGSCSGEVATGYNSEWDITTTFSPTGWSYLEYENILQLYGSKTKMNYDFNIKDWRYDAVSVTYNFHVNMSGNTMTLESSEYPTASSIIYTKS